MTNKTKGVGIGVIVLAVLGLWLWSKRGEAAPGVFFTLSLQNAPAGAVLWNANFYENSFNYDPVADSNWLPIGEVWNYPNSYDKQGNLLYCTTLHIWALDANNNILFDVYNLGPIEDGKSYIYDAAANTLY